MNLAETHDLLNLIRAYDNRNFDDATVIAWHALMADLNADDARQAVMKHFATDTAYLMPVHVRDGVKAIRNERAQAQPHAVRALPSRFEADDVRDERVKRGIAGLARAWSVPDDAAGGSVLERALARSRQERKGTRAATPPKRRNTGGPGIALDRVTTPPAWADPKARESASNEALHAAGRRCGRAACPTCADFVIDPDAIPESP